MPEENHRVKTAIREVVHHTKHRTKSAHTPLRSSREKKLPEISEPPGEDKGRWAFVGLGLDCIPPSFVAWRRKIVVPQPPLQYRGPFVFLASTNSSRGNEAKWCRQLRGQGQGQGSDRGGSLWPSPSLNAPHACFPQITPLAPTRPPSRMGPCSSRRRLATWPPWRHCSSRVLA